MVGFDIARQWAHKMFNYCTKVSRQYFIVKRFESAMHTLTVLNIFFKYNTGPKSVCRKVEGNLLRNKSNFL